MHPTSTVGVVTAPAAQTIGAILIPIGIMALRHHHRVDITTGIIIAAALVLVPWMILPVRTPAARRNSHQVHAAGYVRHCPLVRRTCRPTTRANAGRQPASGMGRRSRLDPASLHRSAHDTGLTGPAPHEPRLNGSGCNGTQLVSVPGLSLIHI